LGLGVWINHFESSFHADDFHTIVNNKAIQKASNIPRFFTNPLTSADEMEYAYYEPLLTANFALDRLLSDKAAAPVFQADTFIWFLLQLLAMYAFFALIPGAGNRVALLATAMFALHPAVAETINYASRRGSIMGGFAIFAGLTIWIVWPRLLPARIIYFDGVPQTGWDEFRRVRSPRINKWYQTFIRKTRYLYLVPVVLGLFADPATAVFAPLLFLFLIYFDPERPSRRVLPSAILCGCYWILQAAFVWRYSAGQRQPWLTYLVSQPLAVAHYFYTFFFPLGMSPVSNIEPPAHPWSPVVLAGFAALAVIVALGIAASRRPQWRAVAFGIWWFLIALAPSVLIPRREIEGFDRMYLAIAGLVFALASAIWILVDKYAHSRVLRIPVLSAATAAVLILAGWGWETYEQNNVWLTESRLWEDATVKSPSNPIGFIRYADVLNSAAATEAAAEYLRKAAAVIGNDPVSLTALARGFDQLSDDASSDKFFKRATALNSGYWPAYSYYAQWLLLRRRFDEARKYADRAVEMNSLEIPGRHILMQYYSAQNRWPEVRRVADETLRIDSTDEAAINARDLSTSVALNLKAAEQNAVHATDVNTYLKLSVAYYQNRRFPESVNACKQALAIRPELAEAYSNMAAAEYAMGNLDATEAALRSALKYEPKLYLAKNNLDFILWLKSRNGQTAQTQLPGSPGQAR
jgi:tetratricopeptide (TPR) repeat protein